MNNLEAYSLQTIILHLEHSRSPSNPEISGISFTAKGIEKLLKDTNPKKASGPDEISARILNTFPSEILFTFYCIPPSKQDSGGLEAC